MQVAPYRNAEGHLVAQHLRTKDKDFPWLGEAKEAVLFGQHLWRETGRMVVLTEGEIDAMSVSQLQGNKWPVVSIGCGAGQGNEEGRVTKVEKYIAKHSEWLERFDAVIIMFDADAQGHDSAQAAASVLAPGKAKIATIPEPYNDVNDMLVAGKGEDLINLIWGAKEYRPDGLVRIEDLFDEAAQPVVMGMPWWLDTMTEATYGRRYAEVYAFGGGTGSGKTDWFTQQLVYDATVLEEKVCAIYLEMPAVELTRRMAGKVGGRLYHIPDEAYDEAQFRLDAAKLAGKVLTYNHFGQTDWSVIKQRIRYAAKAEGIRIFYLDHLTAMADTGDDERGSIETIMKEMAMLAQELNIMIHFVSHLTTPESGPPHEEGGRVMIRHFKGSRSIGFWSHFMFGLERDQQALGSPSTFRVLKDRLTGQSLGLIILLAYDRETGLLSETEDKPFGDETGGDDDIPF